MKTKFYSTLFLLFVGFNLIAQCPTPPTNYEEYQACNATIAATYAPTLFQNTNTSYDDGVNGTADIFTNVDYDGDWNHLNNWNNLPSFSLTPSMYYAVHWTENYLVIYYTLYYARDYAREGGIYTLFCKADEHEGDAARIMVIVDRSTGTVQGTTITTHGDHDSQVAAGSSFTLVDPDPSIPPLSMSGNTPTLYSAAGSHSLYYFLIGYESPDSPNPCRTDQFADPVVYNPGSYTLIDVLAPDGLWQNRYRPNLFQDNWRFIGDDRNENKTPWAPWQGDRVDDLFNFLGDRFNEFNDDACLFCPYDCDIEFNTTVSKSCSSPEATVSVSLTSTLPNTADNLIGAQWFFDPLAFDCIGCDDPTNLSPTFISHNLQNNSSSNNSKPIKVRYETVDCGVEFMTEYIPSSNPDEIYIIGNASFNSGSPSGFQAQTFELNGADVGNVENLTWTLGPHLTCVSGCYNGNTIAIIPTPDAPDGNTYIEATFTNSGENDCTFKIRQKITIDFDKPSLDFDFTGLDLEECVHDSDVLTIPFNYHGTWDFGFPIINIAASLLNLSTGNTTALTSNVEADHNPNDNGWPSDNFFLGDGNVYLQIPEGLASGDYELKMNVTYTNFQDSGNGHYASTSLDGNVHCHDYSVQGSTTFDCIVPLGNLCIIPCNIDVEIEFEVEYGFGEWITGMTAIAASENPGSYQYLWSDESTSNSVTIDCGVETFSLTVTNPLTGCVRVFSEIYLHTNVGCPHEGPIIRRSSEDSSITLENDQIDSATIQNIYPNPSSGIYNILLDQLVEECTVSVYSLASGKLLISNQYKNISNMELDISNQPADIYVLQISIGGQLFYKRIVKI